MGFYPVNPANQEYVIGAPQFLKSNLIFAQDKTFTVIANNLSKENKYVKSVTLNGTPLDSFILKHEDIVQGGTLTFEMTNTK